MLHMAYTSRGFSHCSIHYTAVQRREIVFDVHTPCFPFGHRNSTATVPRNVLAFRLLVKMGREWGAVEGKYPPCTGVVATAAEPLSACFGPPHRGQPLSEISDASGGGDRRASRRSPAPPVSGAAGASGRTSWRTHPSRPGSCFPQAGRRSYRKGK